MLFSVYCGTGQKHLIRGSTTADRFVTSDHNGNA